MGGKVLVQDRTIEKLGKGGIGVVWKARDIRLDRSVVLRTGCGQVGTQRRAYG